MASVPGPFGPLAFGALIPLFRLLQSGVSPWAAARAGFVAGLFFMGGSFGWALFASAQIGPSLAAAYFFAVPLLAAFLGGLLALLAVLAARSPGLALAAAPGLWVSFEYARSQEWLLSIPWSHLGYALADHPALFQAAGYAGLYGLSFWIVAANAVAARFGALGAFGRAVCVAGLALPLAPSLALLEAPPPAAAPNAFRIAAVQPHLAEAERRDGARFQANLASLVGFSEAALAEPADLVAWPESAYQRPSTGAGDAFLAAIAHDLGTPILTGVWSAPETGRRWRNAALLAEGDGRVRAVAEKIHPVPVYERAADGPVSRALERLGLWSGRFEPGRPSAPVSIPHAGGAGVPLGVLVCIDASYPEIARTLRRQGARLLLAISNEAETGVWTAALHARVVRFRAVENGMPVVRIANGGASLWIDARGRIAASLPAGRAGSAAHTLALAGAAPPFVRIGDAPIAVLSALSAAAAALRALAHRNASRPNQGASFTDEPVHGRALAVPVPRSRP